MKKYYKIVFRTAVTIWLTAFNCIASTPPTVTITEPANNYGFIAAKEIPVKATANDPDGSISKVELYINGVYEADMSLNGGKYEYVITGTTAGNYNLKAKAYDNTNDTAITSISITYANKPSDFDRNDFVRSVTVGGEFITYRIQLPQVRPIPSGTPIVIMNNPGSSCQEGYWMGRIKNGQYDTICPSTLGGNCSIWTTLKNLRSAVDKRDWILITPGNIMRPNGVQTDTALLDSTLGSLVKDVNNYLSVNYNVPVSNHKLYMGGGSLGSIATWKEALYNEKRLAGVLVMFGGLHFLNQWGYGTDDPNNLNYWMDEFMGNLTADKINIPVYIYDTHEGAHSEAVTRLYHILRDYNKSVKFVFHEHSAHSPKFADFDEIFDFFSSETPQPPSWEYWNGSSEPSTDRLILDPYIKRTAPDNIQPYTAPEAKVHTYKYISAKTFPQKPLYNKYTFLVADPVIIEGLPAHASKNRLIMLRENDGNVLSTRTGAYRDKKDLHNDIAQSANVRLRYACQKRAFMYIAPVSYELDELENNLAVQYPAFQSTKIFIGGIGYGAQRIAEEIIANPVRYDGILLIDPRWTADMTDTFCKRILPKIPIYISVSKNDVSEFGDNARSIYTKLKSMNKTVKMLEKDVDSTYRAWTLLDGEDVIKFFLDSKMGDYVRISGVLVSGNPQYTIVDSGNNVQTGNLKPLIEMISLKDNDTLVVSHGAIITFLPYDPDGSIVNINYLFDGDTSSDISLLPAPHSIYNLQFSEISFGDHTLKIIANDDKGDSTVMNIKFTVVQNTPPLVEFISPADHDTIYRSQITIKAKVNDSDGQVIKLSLYKNNVIVNSLPIINGESIYMLSVGYGECDIKLRAYDNLGDSGEVSIKIYTIKNALLSIPDELLKCYPNPAVNKLYIHLSNTILNPTEIRIFSANGTLTDIIPIKRGVSEPVIDVSGYAPGIYVYWIDNLHGRFVKQ